MVNPRDAKSPAWNPGGGRAGAATAPARDLNPMNQPDPVKKTVETANVAEQINVQIGGMPIQDLPKLAADPPAKQMDPIVQDLYRAKEKLRQQIIAAEAVTSQLENQIMEVERKISWFERHPEAPEAFNLVERVRKMIQGDS
jgi:hypothetical protein